MRTFLQEVVEGRIAFITDTSGALRILRRIIADKVSARRAQLQALKRDPSRIAGFMGRALRVASAAVGIVDEQHAHPADDVDLYLLGVPSEEVKLISREIIAQFLDMLGAEQRMVMEMRLDRFSIPEIAIKLGRSERTIDRRLDEIRTIWSAPGLPEKGRG